MPRTVHDAAFQVLVDVLMDDPQLSDLVKTWRRWSTDPHDDGSSGPVRADQCPLVWLTPVVGAGATRLGGDGLLQVYSVPMTVEIETWIKGKPHRGLHRSDALDLSALIYGAIWPEDRALRSAVDAKFRTVGVADVLLRDPILPGVFNDALMGSIGSVELIQHVNL